MEIKVSHFTRKLISTHTHTPRIRKCNVQIQPKLVKEKSDSLCDILYI